jgi:serine/threonine-protein kinase
MTRRIYASEGAMKRARLFLACVVMSTVASWPSAALAEKPSKQTAQALFEEGRRLMTAGSLAEACEKLAESQRLDPGAGTLLNLALCYEKRAMHASAWLTYKEAAAAAERSGRAEWATRARTKATALAPSLSTLTVLVPDGAKTPGLEVRLDGSPLSRETWGVALPVDGGSHVVDARAPKHEPWTKSVEVASEREAANVTVPQLAAGHAEDAREPAPIAAAPRASVEPASPAPQHEEEASRGGTQRVLGLVALGAGVVGIGAGTYFGLRASSEHDTARADCNPDETRCGPSGLAAYDDARTFATASTVSFAAGGVLAVAGVVLYLTAPKAARRAGIAPAQRGFGFDLGGTF